MGGPCPKCGTVLLSPREAAEVLAVSDGRVRAILNRHPRRLGGGRVGWGWLVSQPGVEEFSPLPTGVHLQETAPSEPPAVGRCPVCGERLLSPKEAAAALQVSESRVHAILAADPARLLAFRVGRFWFIPGCGLEAYQKERDNRRRIRDALAGRGDNATTVLVIAPSRLAEEGAAGAEGQVKVTFGPEICYCDCVRTGRGKRFPHRPGGGNCPHKPRVLRGMLVAEILPAEETPPQKQDNAT